MEFKNIKNYADLVDFILERDQHGHDFCLDNQEIDPAMISRYDQPQEPFSRRGCLESWELMQAAGDKRPFFASHYQSLWESLEQEAFEPDAIKRILKKLLMMPGGIEKAYSNLDDFFEAFHTYEWRDVDFSYEQRKDLLIHAPFLLTAPDVSSFARNVLPAMVQQGYSHDQMERFLTVAGKHVRSYPRWNDVIPQLGSAGLQPEDVLEITPLILNEPENIDDNLRMLGGFEIRNFSKWSPQETKAMLRFCFQLAQQGYAVDDLLPSVYKFVGAGWSRQKIERFLKVLSKHEMGPTHETYGRVAMALDAIGVAETDRNTFFAAIAPLSLSGFGDDLEAVPDILQQLRQKEKLSDQEILWSCAQILFVDEGDFYTKPLKAVDQLLTMGVSWHSIVAFAEGVGKFHSWEPLIPS